MPKVGILYFFRQCQEFPNTNTPFQMSGVVEMDVEASTSDDCTSKRAKLEKDWIDAKASLQVMSEQTS